MPSRPPRPPRPQARRRRPVPCAVVLCAGLLAGALLPGTAQAAGARSHSQIIGGSRDHSQIIGGSRDHHGFTVPPTHAAAVAPRVRHAG